MKDLSLREILILLPLIFFIVQIGVYPKPFLSRMEASVNHLIYQVESKSGRINADKKEIVYAVDSVTIERENTDGPDSSSNH